MHSLKLWDLAAAAGRHMRQQEWRPCTVSSVKMTGRCNQQHNKVNKISFPPSR